MAKLCSALISILLPPPMVEAWARYCYRKFYADTVIGQLMMRRTDYRKQLFFCEAQQGPDIMGAITMIARSVGTIRILLLVLVIRSDLFCQEATPAGYTLNVRDVVMAR